MMMHPLTWLHFGQTDEAFPPLDHALHEPNGLLAAGGDLSLPRLLRAYRQGIFPWYEAGQPILWWSPDPRVVLFPDQVHVSKNLLKKLRRNLYRVSFDEAFLEVVKACAGPRRGSRGTWITHSMQQAFLQMHQHGYAHSVEVWEGEQLIGGLYGAALGRMFYGESMFAHVADASKIALVVLCRHLTHWGYPIIDSQTPSPHIMRMGAQQIPRAVFSQYLDKLCRQPPHPSPWQVDLDMIIV